MIKYIFLGSATTLLIVAVAVLIFCQTCFPAYLNNLNIVLSMVVGSLVGLSALIVLLVTMLCHGNNHDVSED